MKVYIVGSVITEAHDYHVNLTEPDRCLEVGGGAMRTANTAWINSIAALKTGRYRRQDQRSMQCFFFVDDDDNDNEDDFLNFVKRLKLKLK